MSAQLTIRPLPSRWRTDGLETDAGLLLVGAIIRKMHGKWQKRVSKRGSKRAELVDSQRTGSGQSDAKQAAKQAHIIITGSSRY